MVTWKKMVFWTYLGVGNVLSVPANPEVQEQTVCPVCFPMNSHLAFQWEGETKGFINELKKQMDAVKGEGEKSFFWGQL